MAILNNQKFIKSILLTVFFIFLCRHIAYTLPDQNLREPVIFDRSNEDFLNGNPEIERIIDEINSIRELKIQLKNAAEKREKNLVI